MVFANENMVIVYGAWLEEQFHLQVRELGFFSILVGMAELGGELTVVVLVDRIGKRKAILGGLVLTGLSYLALPFCQSTLYMALAGLVLMFYLFEFTIVSIFPYVSEMVPMERGKWLAFNYTALVIGRLCGALSGPWLWQRKGDIFVLAIVSLAVQTLAPPGVNHLVAVNPNPHAIIFHRGQFNTTCRPGHFDGSRPTYGEVIVGDGWIGTAFSPVKINVAVGTGQDRRAGEAFISEILRVQAGLPVCRLEPRRRYRLQ